MERLKYSLLISISLLFLNCYVFGQFNLNAPAGLSVQPGSASHINLVWEDQSEGEEGFLIESKKEDESFWVKTGFVPSDTQQVQAGGCIANVEYSFRVRAYKGAALSDYSNTAKAKTFQCFEGPQAPVIESSTPRQGERSEEHTSELQSLMRISYAVFCLKKKKK